MATGEQIGHGQLGDITSVEVTITFATGQQIS
jgi:hypothetical protein